MADYVNFDFNVGGLMAIFALLILGVLIFDVWMLIDAIQRPPERFPAPEQKTWWIVGLIVGLVTALPAIVVAIAYYVVVRNAPQTAATGSAYAGPASSGPPTPPPVGGEPAVAYCRNCGAKLAAGARFCHSCGASTT
jgi:hypothetical protein